MSVTINLISRPRVNSEEAGAATLHFPRLQIRGTGPQEWCPRYWTQGAISTLGPDLDDMMLSELMLSLNET